MGQGKLLQTCPAFFLLSICILTSILLSQKFQNPPKKNCSVDHFLVRVVLSGGHNEWPRNLKSSVLLSVVCRISGKQIFLLFSLVGKVHIIECLDTPLNFKNAFGLKHIRTQSPLILLPYRQQNHERQWEFVMHRFAYSLTMTSNERVIIGKSIIMNQNRPVLNNCRSCKKRKPASIHTRIRR